MGLLCDVYIDSDLDQLEILYSISDAIGGSIAQDCCTTSQLVVGVQPNSDWNDALTDCPKDGFLYFRSIAEIDPTSNSEHDTYISEVAKIIEHLWASGIRAVAACDFEHLLPHSGGYNKDGYLNPENR